MLLVLIRNGRFQKISILYHGRLLIFPKGRGGGVHDYGILRARGGIYNWKSKGMGEFHRWDFCSRKHRVSSLKMLLLWTFVVIIINNYVAWEKRGVMKTKTP